MAKLTSSPINIQKILKEIGDPATGGTVIFIGTVRIHDHGNRIVSLEYEAYAPMAEMKLKEIE